MPAAICHFLEQTLLHRAEMETRQLALPWFDAQHPDVQPARKAFVRALAAHGRIPEDKWSSTTQQVIRQLLSYLIRPVPTLLNFVFQGKRTTLSAGTVLQRMGYFAPYAYLRDALRDDVDGVLQQGVDRERLAAVLRPADRIQTEAYAPGDWADHFAPLFALYALVDQEHPPVPTALLCAAFEDKTMEHLAERLRSTENEHFTQDVLRAVLEQPRRMSLPAPADDPLFPSEAGLSEDASPSPSHPSPPAATEEPAEAPPVSQPSQEERSAAPQESQAASPAPADVNARLEPVTPDAAAAYGPVEAPTKETPTQETPTQEPSAEAAPASDIPASDIPASDIPASEAPVQHRFAPNPEQEEPAPSPSEEAEPKPLWQRFQRSTDRTNAEVPPEEGKSEQPRWQQFAPLGGTSSHAASAQRDAETVRTEPVAPLERRLLGTKAAKHRDFFVETLFQGSSEMYHTVLQRLDDADSWAEASQIIASDVFRAHSVNIYSDPAVLFTDLIEARFRQNT
ncbi:MAG: hypothetical protein GVY12_16100 [Bacteroidetes bacterium]|jgi:hypothetical protein|nr:hypothetical protein [Bacteroidota bacterium]